VALGEDVLIRDFPYQGLALGEDVFIRDFPYQGLTLGEAVPKDKKNGAVAALNCDSTDF